MKEERNDNRRRMRKIFAWFRIMMYAMSLVYAVRNAHGATPVLHDWPEEFKSGYYTVSVNGQPAPVFHAGLNVYFVSFDLTGKADVTVKARTADYWQGQARVRPASRAIKPKTQGATASFSITEPGQYSVERPGTSAFNDDVLFVFANPPEKDIPAPTDPHVIYLGPGIHQRSISLKSGQNLYLAPGAVLFGSIDVWNAENVRILGRGVVLYYGPQSEDRDTGWKHQEKWHPLTTHNVKGLTVSGVTIIGRSRTWTLQTHTTFDAVFDNIKILAVNPQNINGDGIDWYGGGRTRVTNSLIRSMDDCFAFFTPGSSQDIWSKTMRTTGDVRDIHIENCVLWPTLANVFRLGFNGQDLITRNVSIKNCDVIHFSKHEWMAPQSLLCVVDPTSRGKGVHSDYLFEKIRFEEPMALLGLQNSAAKLSNIVLRDVSMTTQPLASLITSKVEKLKFEHVTLNGKAVKTTADLPLMQNIMTKN